MQIFRLYRQESRTSMWKLGSMATLSGLANAGILAVINIAAAAAADRVESPRFMVMFVAVLGLFIVAQRYITVLAVRDVEVMINRLRLRLVEKIRHADLRTLEQIGPARLYAGVTKETATISQATGMIVTGIQAGILLTFTLIYIGWLSVTAFIICIVVSGLGVAVHFNRMGQIYARLHEAQQWETRLFGGLAGFFDGFKEIKLSTRRNDALYQDFRTVSETAQDIKVDTQRKLSEHAILTQSMFYLLTAAMVFVVPALNATFSDVVVKTTTSVLFMIGPITALVGMLPMLAMANTSADIIRTLEVELAGRGTPARPSMPPPRRFDSVTLKDVVFQHESSVHGEGFRVGPVNLTIRRGEILFVTGGNGSGKSTLMRLLTALYPPTSGEILVDGVPHGGEKAQAYRELFTAIFGDYHLFRRLYGIDQPPQERVEELLSLLELTGKTMLVGDSFDTVDLSAGQRKRLALLVAMLEDRPILVLDEWAADQDPHYRRKFYTEILPMLRDQGKTIIAVTHDDNYFHCADRQLKMEYGQVVHDTASGGR